MIQKARLTFFGTGTSQGVPIIGCRCPVCSSRDSKNKRFRSSALVDYCGVRILVDAGPDFRMQMLSHGISHLDAILLTHNHKDHTGGLDDVRALNYIDRKAVDVYCEPLVLETLKYEYGYAFAEHKYPGSPEWHIHIIDEKPFGVPSGEGNGELVWVHDKGYFLLQKEIMACVSTENAVDVLIKFNLKEKVLNKIAELVKMNMQEWVPEVQVELVLFTKKHGVLAMTNKAFDFINELKACAARQEEK